MKSSKRKRNSKERSGRCREKSPDGKKNEQETVKGNTEQEVAEPEITEPGGSEQEATEPGDTEPEPSASEENRSGENTAKEQETVALPHPQIDLSQAKLADFDYVMNQFYIGFQYGDECTADQCAPFSEGGSVR